MSIEHVRLALYILRHHSSTIPPVCHSNPYRSLPTALESRTEAGQDISSILHCSATVAGLRARIDASQIPSPIDSIETDKETWEKQMYMTLPGVNPPLSTTDFVAFDQGGVNLAFSIQMLVKNVEFLLSLLQACNVPQRYHS
ncbi:hypothetical protein JVT61DRAFT_15183 [Boletus reticuloceps]|uniref:Uncharacterized protein n=1 Tax=Boletus reticuloceps TaxID=495285 RepID=A0A8I2YU06_9AGAM|nr:hypothetical protein JVT61DRAFT_15183 [Boletus reticuloceps]